MITLNPKTVQAILENLPITININRWGDELYTDKTLIGVREENSTKLVELFDVAFWPPGQAMCFFMAQLQLVYLRKYWHILQSMS